MERHIDLPLTEEIAKTLRMGDNVYLTGVIYTARDAAHERMTDQLEQGIPIPFDTRDATIYYVGPSPAKPGQVIGSAGPTTSGRMDAYSPRLLDLGQLVMIGKGARSPAVHDAIVRNGAVYLAALGGAGALMSACVQSAEIICWEDLGCEAVRRLQVKDMPLTVIIDSLGNDLYQLGPAAYRESVGKK